ncbi:MAG: anti-sigma factor [Acidimicrobiia bacterium]
MTEHLGDLATAYVDGELDDDERIAIDRHLVECERCRVAVAVERSVADLLADLPEIEPPAGFYETMLRRGLSYPVPVQRRWKVAVANVAAVAAVWLVVVSLWQGAGSTVTPSAPDLVAAHQSASLTGAGTAPSVVTPAVEHVADEVGVPVSLGDDLVLFNADVKGEPSGWTNVVVYSDGQNQVSLFRQRAEVRWSELDEAGRTTVSGDRAWRGVINNFEVFVVQRGGYAYALVGGDQRAVDAAVDMLPPAKPPTIVDRVREAAHGLIDAFGLKG